jgi:hypothetical protein
MRKLEGGKDDVRYVENCDKRTASQVTRCRYTAWSGVLFSVIACYRVLPGSSNMGHEGRGPDVNSAYPAGFLYPTCLLT